MNLRPSRKANHPHWMAITIQPYWLAVAAAMRVF